jgi:hypothetical protein
MLLHIQKYRIQTITKVNFAIIIMNIVQQITEILLN